MNDKELEKLKLPEVSWIVQDTLPAEGLAVIAGQGKTHKTWMMVDLAHAVAYGLPFLGYETKAADVLYIALEDTPRRMQSRARIWRAAHATTDKDGNKTALRPTGRLHYEFTWPKADNGGWDRLEQWVTDWPELKLVIIDTLAKIDPVANTYNKAYPTTSRISEIGRKHGVAVIAVHHMYRLGRASSGGVHWMERIQGSIGLTAGADVIFGLMRNPPTSTDHALLGVLGKDVEERTLALKLDDKFWTIDTETGDATTTATTMTTDLQADVMLMVAEHPGKSARAYADMTGRDYDALRRQLSRMVEQGLLVRNSARFWTPKQWAALQAEVEASKEGQTGFEATPGAVILKLPPPKDQQ